MKCWVPDFTLWYLGMFTIVFWYCWIVWLTLRQKLSQANLEAYRFKVCARVYQHFVIWWDDFSFCAGHGERHFQRVPCPMKSYLQHIAHIVHQCPCGDRWCTYHAFVFPFYRAYLWQNLGDDINTESWLLRNLITILSGAAKRPHVPRSQEFRILFEKIGVALPIDPQATAPEGLLYTCLL